MATGLWNSLELLADTHPPAAVLAEWRQLAGADFPALIRFLSSTQRRAQNYPCLGERDCGCRHEVDPAELFSICQCEFGGCEAVKLTPAEIIIHELDAPRFGDAVGGALGFEAADGAGVTTAAPKVWPAGIHADTRSPVFLSLCPGENELLKNLEGVAAFCGEPFIVLSPTARVRSATVSAFLQRERCAFIPLATCLAPIGGGFRVTTSIRPLLERFAAGLANRGNLESRKRKAESESVGPHYSLRKQMGVWQLVFEGRKGLIDDERGVQIVAYLLRNPPSEPVHAVPLETKVWAREWVDAPCPGKESNHPGETDGADHASEDAEMDQEASGAKLDKGENTLLKQKFRELLETIEDTTLPQSERDAAQMELDEIHKSLDGAAGRVVDGASKAAARVRKAIRRLHGKLASAIDEKRAPNIVLRDFATHLLNHLIIPSSRFNRGKGSRNRAGVAGTFIYEPPPGVVWEN